MKDEWLNVRIKYSENDRSKALQALECHWSQFTREEMDDVKEWRVQMNRNDTIYLRSFERKEKITYDFF